MSVCVEVQGGVFAVCQVVARQQQQTDDDPSPASSSTENSTNMRCLFILIPYHQSSNNKLGQTGANNCFLTMG